MNVDLGCYGNTNILDYDLLLLWLMGYCVWDSDHTVFLKVKVDFQMQQAQGFSREMRDGYLHGTYTKNLREGALEELRGH